MPKIHPFPAYRYSGKLSNAQVCPPYDVIDAKMAAQLRAKKHNAVHIELPQGEGELKYKNAAEIWQDWRNQNIVCQDKVPAFYVYQQTFKMGGKKFVRTGFFAEVDVEKPGKGSILRHELTIAGPKVDRLNLIRSAEINTSPIFGLYADSKKMVEKILSSVVKAKPVAAFKTAGVEEKLWLLTDAKKIQQVRASVEKFPIAIADGHHRYETAWNFSRESQLRGARRTLFFLCAKESRGLVVFPTHRIIKQNSDALTWATVEAVLSKFSHIFSAHPVKTITVPKKKEILFTNGKKQLLVKIKSAKKLAAQLGKVSAASKDLALNYVHQILFPDLKKEDALYSHDLSETLRLLKENKTLAILVPAASTEDLYAIVRSGELMPQKSTYFYPKITTGIVFRSVE